MVKVNEHIEYTKYSGTKVNGFYIDGYLKTNLDFLQKQVQNKWDGVGIICGQVGSGKTTISQMIAHYLDPSFNIDRIVFSGQDLEKEINKAQKGQAIVFDEAVMSLSSQDFATELQKRLLKLFTMIRSKNLYIFLIIPNFFLMRKWFCIDRTKFMIYCYSPDGLSRGYFRFYSWNRKKDLYLKGYKNMNTSAVRPNFIGRFSNTEGYFLNSDDYETKKQIAITQLGDGGKTDLDKMKEVFSDAKLKLKIQNEQFRTKLKEKYETKLAQFKDSMKNRVEKYKEQTTLKLDAIKEQEITSKKTQAIKDAHKYSRYYYKLMATFYKHECEQYLKQSGKELSIRAFWQYLNTNYKIEIQYSEVKEAVEKGNDLLII